MASEAQDLYYYYLALGQTQDEVRALLSEPDEVFFSEIAVERDELLILPMDKVRAWFEDHHQDYSPRPVMHDGVASWYRLVPRADVEKALGRDLELGGHLPEADSVGVAGARRAAARAVVAVAARAERYARHRGRR